MNNVIQMPDGNGKTQLAKEFENIGLLPGVIGAIDGTFINIPSPKDDQESYFNRKKDHAIIMQGVCAADKRFLDCNIGWPGSVHDSRVLHNSLIYHRSVAIFAPEFYLIGDAAYPVRPWLMVPYKNTGNLANAQVKFSNTLSKMRVVIEQAFALLKGRFRRLKSLDIRDPIKLNQTVFMCCILHNLCLNEPDLEELLETRNPADEDEDELPPLPDPETTAKAQGEQKRRWLTDYINNI